MKKTILYGTILRMKRLNSDIKNNSFAAVYLLYGDEDYLRLQYKNRLFKAVAPDDTMNTMVKSGKDVAADLVSLRDFTDTLPFFAERRVLLLEDTGLFKSASEGYDRWIESLPETACVIFSEQEVDKRNKLYKAVIKKGYAAELTRPDDQAIGDWVLRKIGQNKLSITKEAFRRFMELVDPDMQTIDNELRKLMDYCMEKGSILPEDVDLIVTHSLTNRIFDMVSAVTAGRRVESLDLYYELLSLKESPMRILYLITRQLNQMLVILRMRRERRSNDEMASALKLRPFIVKKLMNEAAKYTPERLEELIREALSLEEAFKSGDLQENMAAELLIFRMT